jgi:hypothetical protein
VSRRRYPVEVERRDVFGVVKHCTELLGVSLEFGFGEIEPSEIGDFGDIVASETSGPGESS